ncbi:MAG: hypothetical protein K2L70_00755 [Clostridia bacterium]|nr:hypothetical protein [Clostridia bacterium]
MKQIQQLRCIALKLGVSGTALPISVTRLYKGSYGFVKLKVYVPKTQNTEAPLCTAFCTTTDELGREEISSKNYNLIYVGECDLEGKSYLLFETLLPKEFTQKETSPNGLKITFNYFDTAITTDKRGEALLDENGVPKRHATDLLVSSTYTTTVHPGGWNNEDVELNIKSSEAAQIGENTRNISEMQDDILGLRAEDRVIKDDLAKEVKRASDAEEELNEKIGELSRGAIKLGQDVEQISNAIGQIEDKAKEAVETAEGASKTASELADSIAQANATADEANKKANTAVEVATNMEATVGIISKDISEYKEQIDGKVADLEKNIVQGSGGSNVLINGKPQAQIEFTSDPQSQLDNKTDTLILNNKTTLIEKVKELFKIYRDSLIGTEDEISDEDLEKLYQEMEQAPLSELCEFYLELQTMMFYPKSLGGLGYLDTQKIEALCGTTYFKTIGSHSKEDGDFNMLHIDIPSDQKQINIIMFDEQSESAKEGHIRIVDTKDLAESAYWTEGSANIQLSNYGVYMVEFYKYDTSNPRFHVCSLCSYYGSGMQAIHKTESFAPQIVRIADASGYPTTYRYAKAYPYRDKEDELLKIHLEFLDNNETISIIPHIVRYYQIV